MQRIIYIFFSLLEDKQQIKFRVVMSSHLTLFLACFLVIFSRFYQQNIGVLYQLHII